MSAIQVVVDIYLILALALLVLGNTPLRKTRRGLAAVSVLMVALSIGFPVLLGLGGVDASGTARLMFWVAAVALAVVIPAVAYVLAKMRIRRRLRADPL
jgi:hypothetical protein